VCLVRQRVCTWVFSQGIDWSNIFTTHLLFSNSHKNTHVILFTFRWRHFQHSWDELAWAGICRHTRVCVRVCVCVCVCVVQDKRPGMGRHNGVEEDTSGSSFIWLSPPWEYFGVVCVSRWMSSLLRLAGAGLGTCCWPVKVPNVCRSQWIQSDSVFTLLQYFQSYFLFYFRNASVELFPHFLFGRNMFLLFFCNGIFNITAMFTCKKNDKRDFFWVSLSSSLYDAIKEIIKWCHLYTVYL